MILRVRGFDPHPLLFDPVAQLVERVPNTHEVGSSSLSQIFSWFFSSVAERMTSNHEVGSAILPRTFPRQRSSVAERLAAVRVVVDSTSAVVFFLFYFISSFLLWAVSSAGIRPALKCNMIFSL